MFPLSSMTGFARQAGAAGAMRWSWELKCVNGKGLDLRFRLPPGFDALETAARARISARISRGSVQASLALQHAASAGPIRVNRPRLESLLAEIGDIVLPGSVRPASLDGLLALPGIIDTSPQDDAGTEPIERALVASFDAALEMLLSMRAIEGDGLGTLLRARLATIERLADAADATPGHAPDAVRARIAERIALLDAGMPALDPVRLHQEAVFLAAKSDIREELDRLALHTGAASKLLDGGGPVGRRLDFLAQELSREATTLCAKSNDGALTQIGLELRTQIEQFREQVQNLE